MRKAISMMLWVFAAVGLTSIGTAAVNLVTFQVNDSPSAPLSVEALEALPSVPTVPSTAPPLMTSTDPVAPPGSQPTTTTAPPTTSTTTTVPPTTSTSTAPATTTVTINPSTTTTVTSPSTTTTDPVLELRTFNLIGGSVVVELVADGVVWRSSTPKTGFAVSVGETGPVKVVVEFESTDPDNDRSSKLEVHWVEGRLEWSIDEDD